MELLDPRYPRRAVPRPTLVDDFFAPHARPRSLSGTLTPVLLHPGSRLTGRPLLDARPVGPAKLARPEFFIVELPDGRPGLIAAADHTRVWTRPHGGPHRPTTPAGRDKLTGPAWNKFTFTTPAWWNKFTAAIAPEAGFILYAPDSALPNAEDPNQFLRHGCVYDAIDVGLLKQTMDMSGAKWEHAATSGAKWFNDLMHYVALPFKNAQSLRDGWNAVETVHERVVSPPKVKLVVYSGHKITMSQVDSLDYALSKTQPFDGAGDGRFIRMNRGDGLYDSAYQENHHLHGRLVSRHIFLPR